MIDSKDFEAIIEILPLVVVYLVPGYIFLSIVNHILCKVEEKKEYIIIQSIVLSYIILNIDKYIFTNILKWEYNLINVNTPIMIIVSSIILAYIYSQIIISDEFNNFIKSIKIYRTSRPDFFHDILDFDNGNWIRVYLPEEQIIYQGKLILIDDTSKKERFFIMISNYSLYSYDGKCILNKTDDNNTTVVVQLDRSSRYELFYDKNSKITN